MIRMTSLALMGALAFACPALADESNAEYWLRERGNPIDHVRDVTNMIGRGAIADMVTAAAARHGVPVRVAHAIVKIESGYNCRARSWAGAVGIMQTLPRTARGVGVTGPLTDCSTGIEAGMRYLSSIIRVYGVSCASLGLYERGSAARPRCTPYGAKAIRLAHL